MDGEGGRSLPPLALLPAPQMCLPRHLHLKYRERQVCLSVCVCVCVCLCVCVCVCVLILCAFSVDCSQGIKTGEKETGLYLCYLSVAAMCVCVCVCSWSMCWWHTAVPASPPPLWRREGSECALKPPTKVTTLSYIVCAHSHTAVSFAVRKIFRTVLSRAAIQWQKDQSK